MDCSAAWTSITVVSKFARKNTSRHTALFTQHICVVRPGKKGMALKDEKQMEIQNGKDVFARLLTDKASPLFATHVRFLLLVFTTLEGQN